jgi:cytochrome c oxidase cbb3-type subunit 3
MNWPRVVAAAAAMALVLALASGADAADAKKGKLAYTSRCAFCHGGGGQGDGPAAAQLQPPPTNFTTRDFWKGVTPEAIKAAIENGKPGTSMRSFKASLSAEQIDDVITYLQTLKTQP